MPNSSAHMVNLLLGTLPYIAETYGRLEQKERLPERIGHDLVRLVDYRMADRQASSGAELASVMQAFCAGVETGILVPPSPRAEVSMHLATAVRALTKALNLAEGVERHPTPNPPFLGGAVIAGGATEIKTVLDGLLRIGAEYELNSRAVSIDTPALTECEVSIDLEAFGDAQESDEEQSRAEDAESEEAIERIVFMVRESESAVSAETLLARMRVSDDVFWYAVGRAEATGEIAMSNECGAVQFSDARKVTT